MHLFIRLAVFGKSESMTNGDFSSSRNVTLHTAWTLGNLINFFSSARSLTVCLELMFRNLVEMFFDMIKASYSV